MRKIITTIVIVIAGLHLTAQDTINVYNVDNVNGLELSGNPASVILENIRSIIHLCIGGIMMIIHLIII